MRSFLLAFAVSWLDAGHLPPKTKPRPVPIEPDRPTPGPFHAWSPDSAGYYWVIAPDGTRYGDTNRAVVLPFGRPLSK